MKSHGVVPENVIGVSNLMAVLGLAVSGLGIGYLPRQCLQPMLDAKALRVVKVNPALPSIEYVALRRDEGRSRVLTRSLIWRRVVRLFSDFPGPGALNWWIRPCLALPVLAGWNVDCLATSSDPYDDPAFASGCVGLCHLGP